MAPKPQLLIYENEDVARLSTFVKRGESFVLQPSVLLILRELVDSFGSPPFAVPFLSIYFCKNRVPHDAPFVCQRSARRRETGGDCEAESDAPLLSARDAAPDWHQAGMRRRRLWRVHRHAFQTRRHDANDQVRMIHAARAVDRCGWERPRSMERTTEGISYSPRNNSVLRCYCSLYISDTLPSTPA